MTSSRKACEHQNENDFFFLYTFIFNAIIYALQAEKPPLGLFFIVTTKSLNRSNIE